MINIIDYTNLCNIALLNSIDTFFDSNYNKEISINITDKKIKELVYFYLTTELKARRQYGAFNVVIDSCHPNNNWRNEPKVCYTKYNSVDESIIIDIEAIEKFFKCSYTKLKADSEFKFIRPDNIDILDVITGIDRIIGNQYSTNNNSYFIIEDNNNKICRNEKLKNYIFQEIERILITKKLI